MLEGDGGVSYVPGAAAVGGSGTGRWWTGPGGLTKRRTGSCCTCGWGGTWRSRARGRTRSCRRCSSTGARGRAWSGSGLRAAVIAAASGPAGAAAVSRRSLLADNANLRDRARRLEQHARSLEDRLSELLGAQVSQRTGLGPPPDVAALNEQVQALQQVNLDLRRRTGERDEELAAACEANRRLMTELNKARS